MGQTCKLSCKLSRDSRLQQINRLCMFQKETSQGHTWLQWACLSRMDAFSMMCSLNGFGSKAKVFNLTLNLSIQITNALWICHLCDIVNIHMWSSSLWGCCLLSLYHSRGLEKSALFYRLGAVCVLNISMQHKLVENSWKIFFCVYIYFQRSCVLGSASQG